MLNRRVGGRGGKSAPLSHSTAGSPNVVYVERSLDTLSKREMDPRLVFVMVRKGGLVGFGVEGCFGLFKWCFGWYTFGSVIC